MRPPRFHRLCFGALCLAIVAATHTTPTIHAQDGTPPPDPNNDGSHYMHPVTTWTPPVRRTAPTIRNLSETESATTAAAVQGMLERLILPEVSFQNARFAEVIDTLQHDIARLNEAAGIVGGGITIFVKLPAAFPDTSGTPPQHIPGLPVDPGTNVPADGTTLNNTHITLNLRNVPALEALRQVAAQAGLKVKVEQSAVAFLPLSEPVQALLTTEFRVASEFVAPSFVHGPPHDVTGGSITIQRRDAKTSLELGGIAFPPGASATYLPSKGKLVVRNTQENIDLIETLVDKFNQSQPSAPPLSDALITRELDVLPSFLRYLREQPPTYPSVSPPDPNP